MENTESKNSSEDQTVAEGGSEIELPTLRIRSGLEYLETIDKVFVKQAVSLLEVLTENCMDHDVEVQDRSKYVIEDQTGQQVYHAYEESTCCSRCFCCASRALTIHIVDMNGQEIIRVYKPQQMCASVNPCCNCCPFRIEVECPPGRPAGTVSQSCSFWRKPKYVVLDADHNDIFSIHGPCQWPCRCFCCCDCIRDETFRFYSKEDGMEIGKCAKKWSGCFKEIYTKANNFSITFPENLDVREKATLIGAMFLIVVIRVHRPFQLCAGCSVCIKADNCCAYRITVESPPGTPVGYFHQSWWKPRFVLQDDTHTKMFQMHGPCCPCQCFCGCTRDLNFRFRTMDGEDIGTVAEIWTGLVNEMFTKADTFCVTFPKDLDVKLKATMIGAMFLIDFMFFEYEDNNND